MKCWHLVATLALAGCGLNTSSLPSTGRSGEDAGVIVPDAGPSIAGSPASWPARRRPSQLEKDGGSSDTKDASKPGAGGPTTSDKDAQTDPAQGGPANPSPSGQPTSGGPSKPGSQAQPPGSSSGNGSSGNGSDDDDKGNGNGQNGSSSNGNAGAPDAGSSGTQGPDDDDNGSSDEDDHSGNGSNGNGDDDDNSSPGSGSNGNGGQPHNDDAVSIIVDLVIAILDLSLGPVRPAEIEALVSSILVLSLAPADLAAESLVAVLDALDDTQICLDHPERCNPLCTNLESDCSACGRDEDCIERIEEMCKVKLPKTCF